MALLNGYAGKKHEIEVNGHKILATVSIEFDNEQESFKDSFDFGDAEANEEYLKQFERGEIVNVYVTVIARAEGLEGLDTLGSCHIKANDFVNGVLETVNIYSMVETALDELKKEIVDATQRLQKYAEASK